jgi:hypothetical protein
VAVKAAKREVPGVGESRMSNKTGSGNANDADNKLRSQVSIASNSTVYRNVEFVPTLILSDGGLPFHIPQAPSLVHRALSIPFTAVASRGNSHSRIPEVARGTLIRRRCRDLPLGEITGLGGGLPENNGGSSLESDSSCRQRAPLTECTSSLNTRGRLVGTVASGRELGRNCTCIVVFTISKGCRINIAAYFDSPREIKLESMSPITGFWR